jgi:hypothetical protein
MKRFALFFAVILGAAWMAPSGHAQAYMPTYNQCAASQGKSCSGVGPPIGKCAVGTSYIYTDTTNTAYPYKCDDTGNWNNGQGGGPGGGSVNSVNGVAPVNGNVTLTPANIGAAASNASVTVNTQSCSLGGTCTLTPANVGAFPADGSTILPSVQLPIATTSAVGGVKIDGSTISINNGVISAATSTPSIAKLTAIAAPQALYFPYLNGGTGTSIADQSGNGYTCTFGASTAAPTFDTQGNLRFLSSTYCTTAAGAFTGMQTIIMWLKPDVPNLNDETTPSLYLSTDQNQGLGNRESQPGGIVQFAAGGTIVTQAAERFAGNTSVAVVNPPSGNATMYHDGGLIPTILPNRTTWTCTTKCAIGIAGSSTGQYSASFKFMGAAIYSTVLTSAQIQQIDEIGKQLITANTGVRFDTGTAQQQVARVFIGDSIYADQGNGYHLKSSPPYIITNAAGSPNVSYLNPAFPGETGANALINIARYFDAMDKIQGPFDILIGWVICTLIFIMPTVILQIMIIKCTSRPVPLVRSFIEAVLTAGLLSVVIVCTFILTCFSTGTPETDARRELAVTLVITFSVLYFVWIVLRSRFCCGGVCGNDRFMVYDQLRHPVPRPEQGISRIAANAGSPPMIEIRGRAGHEESYEEADIWEGYDDIVETTIFHTRPDGTTWKEVKREKKRVDHHVRWVKSPQRRVDQRGGHFEKPPSCKGFEYVHSIQLHTVNVTVWTHRESYKYGSWDDTTNVPSFPKAVAVTVRAEFAVELTASAQTGLNALKESIGRTARERDTDTSVTVDIDVPHGRKRVTFALNEAEVARVRKYHARWWGIMTWILGWLLGFHTCYECFCSLGEEVGHGEGKTVNMKHVKVVSGGKERRCSYYTTDDDSRFAVAGQLHSRTTIIRA